MVWLLIIVAVDRNNAVAIVGDIHEAPDIVNSTVFKGIGKKRIREENEKAHPELERRLADIPDFSLFSRQRSANVSHRTG